MKIAIIGAGNMGGSIARGLAKGSLIDDSDIIVSNPSAGKLEKLKKEFPGISTTNNNLEAATGADIVILAVKPWFMESVMRELKLKSKQILISVAAGISFEELGAELGLGYKGVAAVYYRAVSKIRKRMKEVDQNEF